MNLFSKVWDFMISRPEVAADPEGPRRGGIEGMKQAVCEMIEAGLEHAQGLAALCSLELGESLQRVIQRLLLLLVVVVLALFAYIFLCAAVLLLLALWVGWIWACTIMFVLHLTGCLVAWKFFSRISVSPLLPKTVQELKSDYECLRILIKRNKNS